ncbi:MAG: hypothetical protein VYD15_02320 [Actinomycetota bacterium]|nr:hypothetical protein [Actinomycetota bacterium]
MVDGAALVAVDVVVIEVAAGAGVLVVKIVVGGALVVDVGEVVGLVVTVGMVGVGDGSSEVQERRATTSVAARARPVGRPAGRRGRRRLGMGRVGTQAGSGGQYAGRGTVSAHHLDRWCRCTRGSPIVA